MSGTSDSKSMVTMLARDEVWYTCAPKDIPVLTFGYEHQCLTTTADKYTHRVV